MSAPRAYLFTRPLSTRLSPRTFTTSTCLRAGGSLPFNRGPSPPRLPEEDQKIFEELQRQSTGAFSTPAPQRNNAPAIQDPRQINQSPDASGIEANEARSIIADRLAKLRGEKPSSSSSSSTESSGIEDKFDKRINVNDNREALHPNLRRGAAPEFEGDVNPKTGEVGGPKNEPLRWGGEGEWSYNGRTTDF